MKTQQFDELSAKILAGTACGEEYETFVEHATALRVMAIDSINHTDAWDEDWPIVGYKAVVGVVVDQLMTWAEDHGWQP